MLGRRILTAAAAMLTVGVFMSSTPAFSGDNSDGGASSAAAVSLTNFQAASVVVGQPDFTSGLPNQGANAAADTIDGAFGNASIGPTGILYLSDYDNQRVLGFNTVPTSNDVNADFVLGQPDFTSTGGGTAANQFGGPQTTVIYNNIFLVDDFYNHRVLVWKKAPTSTQVPASAVIGQKTFGTRNSGCTAKSMNAPETISVGAGKLVVADSSNARVLIYKKFPKSGGGKAANIVLGQGDLTTCAPLNDGTGNSGGPTAANFSYPAGVWTDGTRIVVTDEDENRVLIWNKFPKKNFSPADVVLGQPDFTSEEINNNGSGGSGAPSAKNMNMPYDGVFSNGTQLFVDDQKNNRILVWNTFPTTNFAAADVVLGQPNFTCGVRNNDGTGCTIGSPSASNLDDPTGIFQFGSKLVITDGGNSRFLIFN